TAYQLYESKETVLLLADPRARSGYLRQDASDSESADEKAQCRRCQWPGYLPDPEIADQSQLGDVTGLLAGRYGRAFLFAPESAAGGGDPDGIPPATLEATRRAIALFERWKDKYPLPARSAVIAGADGAVQSPVHASLA